jgi:hypothetical protein
MFERPILFSDPMVRAILEGRKTQTRRVVARQPPEDCCGQIHVSPYQPAVVRREELEPGRTIFGAYCECGDWGCRSPYGAPGDRLWVREAWAPTNAHSTERCWYRATLHPAGAAMAEIRWRPSIHMPRWASRITLEVTGVRVERLQDITHGDLEAEGIPIDTTRGKPDEIARAAHFVQWRALWESINGKESWAVNPWVWVVEFRRLSEARTNLTFASEAR